MTSGHPDPCSEPYDPFFGCRLAGADVLGVQEVQGRGGVPGGTEGYGYVRRGGRYPGIPGWCTGWCTGCSRVAGQVRLGGQGRQF